MAGMCRLCASLKHGLIAIDKSEEIREKLYTCCRLHIQDDDEDDMLPNTICPFCMDELNSFYKFYIRVQEAQETLQSFFSSQPKKRKLTEDLITQDGSSKELFSISSVESLADIKEEYVVPEAILIAGPDHEEDYGKLQAEDQNNKVRHKDPAIKRIKLEKPNNKRKYLQKHATDLEEDSCHFLSDTIKLPPVDDEKSLLKIKQTAIDKHLQTQASPDNKSQMYGEYYDGDKMVDIGNNIFCRQSILKMALTSSTKSSHVVRKLLDGVFTMPSILRSTLTGLSPRAQGKERQQEKFMPLNPVARAAIINFAINIGKQRRWEPQSIKLLEKAISQRIGELKRLEQRKLGSIRSH